MNSLVSPTINPRLIELEKKTISQYVVLTTVVVIAAILRFHNLGEWSFWGDEMFTVGGREDGFNYSLLRESISLLLIQATVDHWGK